MAWAIEQQDVTEPVARFVLLCLANYAAADGSAAFPSVTRLARDTGLSERAVQKHLRKLEELAVIRPGNKAFAAAKIARTDRLPKVYDILLSRGAPDSPRSVTGCTGRHDGVNGEASRGEPRAPDPKRSVRKNLRGADAATWEEEFRRRFGVSPAPTSGPAEKKP